MNRDEYEIMRRVEDTHWWYGALRARLLDVWRAYVPKGAHVLDAGCGTGANLAALAPLAHTVGIDYAREAVSFCRELGQARTSVASIVSLPFQDNAFDAVLSFDVLCHRSIENKEATLGELLRVTNSGGILVLNLPAFQWLYSSHDIAVHTNKRFTRGEMKEMAQRQGADVVRIGYWNSLLFPLLASIRLWRKRQPLASSDLDGASGQSLGPVFGALLAIERVLGFVIPWPAGLSVLVVLRKK